MKKFLSVIILLIFCFTYILPVNAITKDDYVAIDRNTKHLGSRLHKEYTGYVYTIKNISNEDILIESISFKDNISGKVAYKTISRSSLGTGLKTIGVGLAFALPTLTLSLIGSVIVAPFTMIGNACGNIGANRESKKYDKLCDTGYLKPSSELELKTLGARLTRPEITVLYHLKDSDELIKLSY